MKFKYNFINITENMLEHKSRKSNYVLKEILERCSNFICFKYFH